MRKPGADSDTCPTAAGTAAKFAVCCGSLYAASAWLPGSAFAALDRHTATTAWLILSLCGFHPFLNGTTLSQGAFSIWVIPECTALYAGILFSSVVAACTASPRRKLAGLALGLPVLHVGNALRIALVFAIGLRVPALFQFAHVYLGQGIMTLFLIAVCLVWLRGSRERIGESRPLSSFIVRFVAFSAIPFIFWLYHNGDYVRLTDHLVRWLFSLCNYRLIIPDDHVVYYQTFNLVTYVGLVMAGGFRLLRSRWRLVAAGAALIISMHIAFRICNVFMTAFGIGAAYKVSSVISITGQYLLPVLFCFLILPCAAQSRISQDCGQQKSG